MKKLALAYLAVFSMTILTTSCTKFMEEEDGYEKKTPHTAAQVASVGSPITSNMEVLSDELSYVTINNLNTNEVVDQFYVRRHHETIDLGSRETSEYGEWYVGSSQIGEPVRVKTRAEGLFTITTYRVTVTSIISNGEVEFKTSYDLEYEDWSWSNGDTTIVGNVHWDVENEVVVRNGSKVQDQLNLNFHEFKQTVSETGTLLLNNAATPNRFATGAKFTVTRDINNTKNWFVGVSIARKDSTGVLVFALEKNGTPVASRIKYWPGNVCAQYNSAYYVKNAWYPAIASDQTDGMEWKVEGKCVYILPYADADNMNWGNDNIYWKGQNSVEVREYSYKENPETQTITFYLNGSEAGSYCYAGLF